MNEDEFKKMAEEASEEELRAKSEAAMMGQMMIVESALAALIMQAPHPSRVERAISECLHELAVTQAPHPALAWSTQVMFAGANASADRILHPLRSTRKG